MSILRYDLNHGVFHGMFNNTFCGWNSFAYWNWNSPPQFYSPNYMPGNFFAYSTPDSSLPLINNIDFRGLSKSVPNWEFDNQSVMTNTTAISNLSFSSNTIPSLSVNYDWGDTYISSRNLYTSTECATQSTKQSETQRETTAAKHWSKMTDAELEQIYGNYKRDITQKYTGSVEVLNRYLFGKGVMEGKGQAFLDAQSKYGISAAVLVAICSHESGYGKSNLAKNKNNLGGIRCSGSKEFRAFESVEECIDYMASLLKNSYVNNSGRSLTKLYQINAKYCPVSDVTDKNGGNSGWARAVEAMVKQVEAVT